MSELAPDPAPPQPWRGGFPGAAPRAESPDDFRALFEAEFAYVWRSLRRCGVAESDLDDVAQEVFLRIYRHLGDYDASRPLRPWLFGFAIRVAADWRKLAHHRREVTGAPDVASDSALGMDEQLIATDRRALVSAALDKLDLDHRAVFILHDIEGYKIPEIAGALSIPVFTAYSRLRAAREKFAAYVRQIAFLRGDR